MTKVGLLIVILGFAVLAESASNKRAKRQYGDVADNYPQQTQAPAYHQPAQTAAAYQQPQPSAAPTYQQPQPPVAPTYQQPQPSAAPTYQQPQPPIAATYQQPQPSAAPTYPRAPVKPTIPVYTQPAAPSSNSGRSGAGRPPAYPVDGGDLNNLPGQPGKDYPIYGPQPPPTNFLCSSVPYVPGHYANVDFGCQVWHICEQGGKLSTFLCPNGTLFNQLYLVCDWWYHVKCGEARNYYSVNANIFPTTGYGGPAPTPGGRVVPPSQYPPVDQYTSGVQYPTVGHYSPAKPVATAAPAPSYPPNAGGGY